MRDVLERAIAENFDDVAAHAAYADWLAERGDPRGEFIQVQLALEDESKPSDERKLLRARERELLLAHERIWLGPLARFLLGAGEARLFGVRLWKWGRRTRMNFAWRRGWLDSLELPPWQAPDWSILAAIQLCPYARHLHRLAIPFTTAGDEFAFPPPPNLFPDLRVFEFGEARDLDEPDWGVEFAAPGFVVLPLVQSMPRLEELYVRARDVAVRDLFALRTLDRLRTLQVYHVEVPYPLSVLAANPALSKLERLWLHPSAYMAYENLVSQGLPADTPVGSMLPLAEVRALLTSPHLTSLRHLQLRGSDLGDDGCEALVNSPLLKTLRVLDLRFGRITDRGARVLAASPALRRLERLDLRNNQMSPAGVATLKAALPQAQCDHQDEPGSDDYIYSGDIE